MVELYFYVDTFYNKNFVENQSRYSKNCLNKKEGSVYAVNELFIEPTEKKFPKSDFYLSVAEWSPPEHLLFCCGFLENESTFKGKSDLSVYWDLNVQQINKGLKKGYNMGPLKKRKINKWKCICY